MRKTMVAIAALACCAAAPPVPAPPQAAEPKLICKKISDNPTEKLAPKRKVCMTAAQWRQARRNAAVEMPKAQAAPSRY